jgi:allophanate hydrolase subunit 1
MHARFWSYSASILILILAATAWVKQDALFDAWRLRSYTPPAEVARLADATTMTSSARRLFYVYQPVLEDKSSFNQHCSNSEQTIVLGCYIERQGIYLYDISDQRLEGVVEVTAAHEMLHAAYDRLGDKERQRIDGLTAQVAEATTDERLKSTIENYRKKDPTIVPNELHSILATEVRNLPADLEAYYKRYFTNRKTIVDLADRYKQAFTERENQVKSIDVQLAVLKSQIDALNGSLESQQKALQTRYEDLQQKRSSGNVEEYNAAVPGYNQAVVAYNSSVNKQKQLVTQYNSLVEQRNALATEENELIKALDSRSTIQQQ